VSVALVSTDYNVKELAAIFGVPVFSTTSSAQGAKWPERPSETPQSTASNSFDDDMPRPRKPLLDRLGLAGAQLVLTLMLFGVAAILLAGAAILLIPSANVTVFPAAAVVSDSSEVILDPSVNTIDQINAIIPAGTYRREISGTMTISTTKTATAPADHSSGDVVFTNLQGTEATIPLGTVVATTSGVTHRYSTTITATLPAGFNARVSVPVNALEPGPDSNVKPLQINFVEGPLSAVARVVNVSPLAGGTIKDVHIVSFDDKAELRQKLDEELRQQAIARLQSGKGSDVYVVPASVNIIVLNETFDHLVDDPTDSLSLHIEAVADGIFADYSDFQNFAQQRLLSKMPDGYSMLPGTLRVEADSNARVEGSSAILKVRGALLGTPQLKSETLLEGLNGKTVSEATRLIGQRVELAEPPKIRVNPNWWNRMPFFGFRTVLQVIPTEKSK
jgi:Baseplate J-like protein